MKVRLPKDPNQFSIRDLIWVQKMMLQGTCILLNQKPFCFGRKRLTLLLGGWCELYRILGKFKTRTEQDEYLDSEINRIFKIKSILLSLRLFELLSYNSIFFRLIAQ